MNPKQIEDELDLEENRLIHNLTKREHQKENKNLPPKKKGRPRKSLAITVESYKKEICRLETKNKLLRDFL